VNFLRLILLVVAEPQDKETLVLMVLTLVVAWPMVAAVVAKIALVVLEQVAQVAVFLPLNQVAVLYQQVQQRVLLIQVTVVAVELHLLMVLLQARLVVQVGFKFAIQEHQWVDNGTFCRN
jgi:hypothetical protein